MIFSFLAFIFLTLSICVKKRKFSLQIQTFNCFFELLYNITLHSYTMVVLNLISVIRSFIFTNSSQIKKNTYFLLLVFFELLIIFSCFFTWNGIFSVLPTTGSIFRTYSLWQDNMKLIRISGIISGLTYGIYYFLFNSWFLVLGYSILFLVSLIMLIKNIQNKNP